MKKEKEDEVLYYQILTHFDSRLYVTERNYQDFVELQKQIMTIYSDVDLIKQHNKILDLPSPTFDQKKFIEMLEKYLNGLLKNLNLINFQILNFLNVFQEDQIPFLKYQDLHSKNKTSIIANGKPRLLHLRSDSSTNSRDKDEFNFSMSTSPAKLFIVFEIFSLNWIKTVSKEDTYVIYEFQLNRKKSYQSWIIRKKYSDIKNFHVELEKQIGKPISLFNDLVPRASNYSLLSDEFLDIRQKKLEKYLQSILACKLYYCPLLYEFLEYDFELERPNTEGELEGRSQTTLKYDTKIEAFTWVTDEDSEIMVLDFSKATPRHLKNIKQQNMTDSWNSPYFKSSFILIVNPISI